MLPKVAQAPPWGALRFSDRALAAQSGAARQKRSAMHRIMNGARIWFDVEGAGLVQDGPVMQQRPTLVAEAFWTDPGNAAKVRTYIDECFPLYNPTPRPLDADRRSTFNPAMLHHFFRDGGEGFRFDFRDRLKDVRCPTLVLAGDLDPVTPMADADDIAAALPSALVRYERFVGAGHGVGRDQPDRYFAILRDFLAIAAV